MPNLDWNSIISRIKLNPFISVLDNIQSTIPNINPALNILRSAFNEPKQSQVLHIHIVGDGKAGKSVATKWLIELFEKAKCQKQTTKSYDKNYKIDKHLKYYTKVQTGRTRGVNTTTLRFQDKIYDNHNNLLPSNDYLIMIHDYGGQEEFLSNHANFLSTNNSIYIIIIIYKTLYQY